MVDFIDFTQIAVFHSSPQKLYEWAHLYIKFLLFNW